MRGPREVTPRVELPVQLRRDGGPLLRKLSRKRAGRRGTAAVAISSSRPIGIVSCGRSIGGWSQPPAANKQTAQVVEPSSFSPWNHLCHCSFAASVPHHSTNAPKSPATRAWAERNRSVGVLLCNPFAFELLKRNGSIINQKFEAKSWRDTEFVEFLRKPRLPKRLPCLVFRLLCHKT